MHLSSWTSPRRDDKEQVPQDFYLHFLSSNWSSWDPNSWVKIILQIIIFVNIFKFKFFCRCGIQRSSIFCAVGYNGEDFSPLWDTMEEVFFLWRMQQTTISGWLTIFFHCIPQRRSISSVVGYTYCNGSGFLRCIPQLSHNTEVFIPLYPTPQRILIRWPHKHRSFFRAVSYTRQ